jgi:hypothetical protein
MIRKRMFFCFLVFVMASLMAMPAFGANEWVRAMGGGSDDYGRSVIEVSGTGIVITGATRSYGAGSDDLLLAKFNGLGTLQWTKALGGASQDLGNSLIEASDGSIVVVGMTYSYGAGLNDLMLSKFNSSGIHQWTRTLGGSDDDKEASVVETSDGGFAIAGWTKSYGAGDTDIILSKFNSSGTHQWTRTLGGINGDYAKSLVELSDLGLVVIGGTVNYGAGGGDLLLAKFSSAGTLQWTKTLGGTGHDYGQNIIEASDGSIVVAGMTASYGAGFTDLMLSKFNSSGTHQWTRVLGGSSPEDRACVTEASDGGFVITGWTDSYGAGSTDFLIAKYSSSGVHQWTRVMGGSSVEYGYFVTAFSDGDFVVTGGTQSYGAGGSDVWLSKHAPDGTTCLGSTVSASLASPSPSIGTPSPTVGSPSPGVSSPSPSTTSPTGTVDVVCDSGPGGIPTLSAPMMAVLVLVMLILSSLIIIRRRAVK